MAVNTAQYTDLYSDTEPLRPPVAQFHGLSADVLRDLRSDWIDLSSNASEPNPFLEPFFVEPALGLFPDSTRPGVLVMRSGARLVGLMFLRQETGYAGLPVPYAITHEHPHQFLGTPLVRKGCEAAFAEALCGWLDDAPRRDQFLVLNRQIADGPVLGAIGAACIQRKQVFYELERRERPMAVRTNMPEEYLADAISARSHKNLRAKLHRIGEHGALGYEELAPDGDPGEWIEGFLKVEQSSWKGDTGTSLLSNIGEAAFFRTAMHACFEQGRLRASRLKVGDRVVSYAIDIAAGRALFAFKAAYDPAFAKYSPGVLLDYISLKSFLENRDYDWIDSCATGDHPVLNGMWRERRAISGVVIGRRNFHSHISLKMALAMQSAARAIRRRWGSSAGNTEP